MYTIRNAQLSTGRHVDIDIHDHRIVRVAPHVPSSQNSAQDIDATGFIAFPGGVDMHVHFRTPGLEHKEDWVSGSRVALSNGYTTVCDMPNTVPPTTTLARVREKKSFIEKNTRVRFALYIGATKDNLQEVIAAQNEVCGVKVYYGTSTGGLTMNDPALLKQLFAARIRVPIVIHAEDDHRIAEHAQALTDYHGVDVHSRIRDRDVAISAVAEVLSVLRQEPAARVHITHISTAEEVTMIRDAQQSGLQVTADVTPHHLLFTEERYAHNSTAFTVNPPLRLSADNQALFQGLRDGVISCIASDHAPHTRAEKINQPYAQTPAGLPSLEYGLLALLEHVPHVLSYAQLEHSISTEPARLCGWIDRGRIVAGAFADIMLIDPRTPTHVSRESVQSRCGWSPWEGATFSHSIAYTILGGEIRYMHAQFI